MSSELSGTTGLDVGANVRVPGPHPALRVPAGRCAADLAETYVPHYLYYSEIGCVMHAIALHPVVRQVMRGDARLLLFADSTFHFVTAPMLLGSSNVCATPLEIAFCLSEFDHVLHPGGFVYLADPYIYPAVVYCAQLIGFTAYASKGLPRNGLPVGVSSSTGSKREHSPIFAYAADFAPEPPILRVQQHGRRAKRRLCAIGDGQIHDLQIEISRWRQEVIVVDVPFRSIV